MQNTNIHSSQEEVINPLSVTDYLTKTDQILKGFGSIYIEGEVSAVKAYSHIYFQLRDEQSSLECILFTSIARNLRFKLQEGQKVIVAGKGSVYPKNGSFKLVIDSIRLAGEGYLFEQVRLLGDKLRAEGIFNKPKRAIPQFVDRVGVITSYEGSVFRDIVSVLNERNRAIEVKLYRAPVQGVNAHINLIKALKEANDENICDVLVIGRGGGSYSDLMPFNEESLVREIVKSRIPIISAVGHEPDFTLSDEAADVRAATPTHAAVLVSAIKLEHIQESLDSYTNQLKNNLDRMFDAYSQALYNLNQRLEIKNPLHKVESYSNFIDLSISKLEKGKDKILSLCDNRINNAYVSLAESKHSINLYLEQQNSFVDNSILKLNSALNNVYNNINERFNRASTILNNISLDKNIDDLEAHLNRNIERMHNALLSKSKDLENRVSICEVKLSQVNFNKDFDYLDNKINDLATRQQRAFLNILEKKSLDIDHSLYKLTSLNPLNILKRGYSLTVHKDSNKAITKDSIKEKDIIVTKIAGAILTSVVTEVKIEN